MLPDWLRRHRSALAGGASTTAILALVATAAVVSTGYTAQKVTLGDGAVWVANASAQAVGRANPAVLELNAVVPAASADPRVVQDGATVLVVDEAEATLDILDPVTATLGEKIALPPDQPRVDLAAGRAVIHSAGTGEVWIVPVADLAGFDPAASQPLSLGPDVALSLSPAGILAAVSPSLGEVDLLDVTRSDAVERRWSIPADPEAPAGSYRITTVGGRWAVLDTADRRLVTEAGERDLGERIPAGGTPVLQEPSDDGDAVLLAWTGGLASFPLDGGAGADLLEATGVPTEPLVAGGCAFAAWASGLAWRRCGDRATTLDLSDVPAGARLAFAANGDSVVLNDASGGASWAVQDAAQRIDNWAELIVPDDAQQEVVDDPDQTPEVEAEQKPPVAVDDEFGARPGRATVLPVLVNDYDPNADVLVISDVEPIPESIGRLDVVTRRQQLQLTLAAGASGSFSFRYTIDDGRGGTASATVTVTVRREDENSPPEQLRTTTAVVREGGRVTTQVLGDWIDPDGDPFYLAQAATAPPNGVSFKPDGVVVYTDVTGSSSTVALTMTDGRASGSGSLRVDVRPAGQVPILVDSWAVLATAGEDVTVRVLPHVRGGSGPLRLGAVPARTGTTITPSFETGTFVFSSTRVGAHYVSFTVTDGDLVQDGVVRIDVAAPVDAGARPITVPQSVFVRTLSSASVDPTLTDIDPAGGVLVVTGVTDVPSGSGVRAEVIGQREVRVTLTAPLEGRTVELHYRISNGIAEAEGTITVVEIARPDRLQPPIAVDDSVTVRVGAVVDIPVLDNDEQPDGGVLSLQRELAVDVPEDGGLLFVSGDELRYLAPETAGNYSAVYSVESGGQVAQARVRISVREVDQESNSAPVPRTVTARVLAGETVTIDVPLASIDPDGDAVQLIGVASSPEKGAVVSVDAGRIVYQAGDYSSGTDSFRYTVVDRLGARAEGVVRVGISPRMDGARNPVANADTVQVRPGRSVSVQVLANDTDPDGSPLHVTTARPNSPDVTAEVVDDEIVTITPPRDPGSYAVVYTVANDTGGSSSAFVTVVVDPEAPLAVPIARDAVLTINDVLDRESVDIDVLSRVFWADGAASELGVELVPGYGRTAQVLADKRIRAVVGDTSQVIPFSIVRPDDPSVRATAFLWVPGRRDALPQLDRTAPPLVVESEQPLRIDLDDYVVSLGSSGVRLVDQASVQATHANGADLVVDDHTLVFTSADRYFGPASITFEVTDGRTATDPDGRRAILTLPIRVDPRENQPPSFRGAVVDFEPGQSKELDLVRLTDYPYDDDLDELAYTVLDPAPTGFSVQLNGQRLVLTADVSAPKGTTTAVQLGVRDAINEGSPGRITLQVVPSTRPLAQPQPDSAVVRRGETTVVDVLGNDRAGNPFPGDPLTVVAIRGLDGASLPAGVTITPSADSSTLRVTVADSAQPLDTSLQYEIADASRDPDRYVWGSVTISVQDVPDAVTDVRVTEFGDRSLKLSWTPGAANNSPIDHYELRVTEAGSGAALSTVSCTTTVGCQVTTPGNGPDRAVRVAVVAVNAIGASDPVSNAGGAIWSDIIPPPPVGLGSQPLDHGLRVTWRKPADASAASPIDRYVVTVGGETRLYQPSGLASDPPGTVYTLDIAGVASIANGSSVGFTVSARNGAPTSLTTWNSASGTGVPAWTPLRVGSPTASGVAATDGTVVSASWAGAFDANGRSIAEYRAGVVPTGSPLPSWDALASGSVGTATTTTFPGLTPNVQYTVVVYASNGLGTPTEAATATAIPRAQPGIVTAIATTDPEPSGDATWDVRLTGVTAPGGAATGFRYRFATEGVDGSESAIVPLGTALTTGNGSQYGVAGSVQVQACAQYPEVTLCSSDWSAPLAIGIPVSSPTPGVLAATLASGGVLGSEGDWSWQSSPAGSGYQSVAYSCDGETWTELSPQGAGGSCHATGGLLADPHDLVIRITAGGQQFDRSYTWDDFEVETP